MTLIERNEVHTGRMSNLLLNYAGFFCFIVNEILFTFYVINYFLSFCDLITVTMCKYVTYLHLIFN